MKKEVSISSLYEKTGADRRSIKKWLADAGVEPGDPKALEVIANRQKTGAVNPTTGLPEPTTWFQEKTRQDAIKLQRENETAEKLKDGLYLESAVMEKQVVMFTGKLELIPVKLESEFSVEPKIIKRLTELLDEARQEMAKGILK